MGRFSAFGWVMVIVTLTVAIALLFTRATIVLVIAVAVALFWGYVVQSRDPVRRRLRGDDPATSQTEQWRDRDI